MDITKEITLRGQVTAVGCINEKLLAARRPGVETAEVFLIDG